jgi:hypothetical protein
MGRNVEFTGKVGAKQMSFMIDEDKKVLHTAYYVFLETKDGGEVTVKDESSPVGMMEGETRYKAIKKGKRFLEKIQEH